MTRNNPSYSALSQPSFPLQHRQLYGWWTRPSMPGTRQLSWQHWSSRPSAWLGCQKPTPAGTWSTSHRTRSTEIRWLQLSKSWLYLKLVFAARIFYSPGWGWSSDLFPAWFPNTLYCYGQLARESLQKSTKPLAPSLLLLMTSVIRSFMPLIYRSITGCVQDAGYAVQLEREEIQRVVSSCNEYAEADKRSTS